MQVDNIKYTSEMFIAICSSFWLKCVTSVTYAFYAFSFDTLQGASMRALFILIIFDFLTGVASAKKTGEEIKSSKIFRTALKITIYFLLVSSGHLVSLTGSYLNFVSDTIIAFLALTELISILENAGKLGFAVPKKLLGKLQKYRDGK